MSCSPETSRSGCIPPATATDRRANSAESAACIVIAVDDANAHYAYTKEHGADILNAPVDQPYGVREYDARDLEGHLWYIHSPLD